VKIRIEMDKIEVIVEQTSTGYSAYAKNYPAFTTGESLSDLKSNMVESINLFLEMEGQGKSVSQHNLAFLIMD